MRMGKVFKIMAKQGKIFVRGTMAHAVADLARLYKYDSQHTTSLHFTAVHSDVVFTFRRLMEVKPGDAGNFHAALFAILDLTMRDIQDLIDDAHQGVTVEGKRVLLDLKAGLAAELPVGPWVHRICTNCSKAEYVENQAGEPEGMSVRVVHTASSGKDFKVCGRSQFRT